MPSAIPGAELRSLLGSVLRTLEVPDVVWGQFFQTPEVVWGQFFQTLEVPDVVWGQFFQTPDVVRGRLKAA